VPRKVCSRVGKIRTAPVPGSVVVDSPLVWSKETHLDHGNDQSFPTYASHDGE